MARHSPLSRRSFLRRTAALGAPLVLSPVALGRDGKVPPSDRVAMAFVGTGSHGIGRNLRMFCGQRDARVVALCDVDRNHLARGVATAKQRRPQEAEGCLVTGDFRPILDRADVDGVMISTPDHWHVPISVAAVRAGKDVICEKPTLTVAEGRVLADTVARYGAVFQMSTEDRSVAVYHRMAELVRNGRIGRLQRIQVVLPAGPGGAGDPAPRPVPEELDYEMWLGPAPYAPYCPGRVHRQFRFVRDYSGGELTDWGSHLLDTAQWANDTERTGPVEIEGTGKRHHRGLYDTYYQYRIHYRYASGVRMEVRSGGVGIRFEGTDGWVGNSGWRGRLEASSQDLLHTRIGPSEVHLFTCRAGEHRNFLDCVKSRRDPYFPAEIGHRCCSVAHLGNIAIDLGRKLTWDPRSERFPGDEAANRLLSRAMRAPWTV
ncbi:MAG: Gfo/Idh/MocA family protein [Candidatus Brocadiia bacterium]